MVKTVITGANGKMGKVLQDIISNRDDCVCIAGIDLKAESKEGLKVYKTVNELSEVPDVIIDFSHPSALESLLDYALSSGCALILATTGYSADEIEKIKTASNDIPIFYTANMSLGINLLSELAKKAAAVLGDQFDIEIVEKHHNQKLDAPSGTALMLANGINKSRGDKYTYVYDRHSVRQKRSDKEIGIHAIRGGTIVGEHDIIFAGRDEVITLSHSAASKEVFAVGAVNAAVFMKNKPAGLYTMADMI